MKISLAQYQPRNLPADLDSVLAYCETAAGNGAQIIFFNQFFLGLTADEYNPSLLQELADCAAKNRLGIVTGGLTINVNGCKAVSAYFDAAGNLAAYQTENTTPCRRQPGEIFSTPLGKTLVLSEYEAYDDNSEVLIQSVKPQVIVMQVSAVSSLEAEAVKKLTIDRSLGRASLVLTVSMTGKFAGKNYLGCTTVSMRGKILAELEADDQGLLTVDVEPNNFLNYQALHQPVIIPELLRQKLTHESSH